MPSSAICTFNDPEMYFRGIRNLQIDGVITKRGEFRAESTHIDLHRLRMYRSDESVPRIMKVAPSGMRAGIVFATDPDGSSMLINGVEIADGQISRNGLDWEWYLRSSAPCRWGSVSLMPEDLAAASKAIIGGELVPASFAGSLTPPTAALSRLRKLHEAADQLAKTAPDILAQPEVARAMETALVEAMIFCIADRHSGGVRNVHRHRAKVMRRENGSLSGPDTGPAGHPERSGAVYRRDRP